jgi:GTP pyrophosphokinase
LLAKEKEDDKINIGPFVDKIKEALSPLNQNVYAEIRYRTPYSIWRKMQSLGCDFGHVDGKHYIRIVYGSLSNEDSQGTPLFDKDCEKKNAIWIYSDLTSVFKERPGSVVNYIDNPKENGYQSFHVKLLSDRGTWEEIHISSEQMVRNSRLGCAAERTEDNVSQWLKKFKGVLLEVAFHSKDMDYMDGVTASFYNDDIMAFTPHGQGIILPKGATALDFAYEIHSDIGKHAVYARINGKLMSVKTVLHRGDCVEIGTDENSLPDPEWINHVLTFKAKRQLFSYISTLSTLEYQRCPHCHPLPQDEVIGFKSPDGTITLHKRNCPSAIRMASHQGDSIVAVDFKENDKFQYPVRVQIRSVDRYHLLIDVIDCITERLHLFINKLVTETVDRIVVTTIDFTVRSAGELDAAIKSIYTIKGVDEVYRLDIE